MHTYSARSENNTSEAKGPSLEFPFSRCEDNADLSQQSSSQNGESTLSPNFTQEKSSCLGDFNKSCEACTCPATPAGKQSPPDTARCLDENCRSDLSYDNPRIEPLSMEHDKSKGAMGATLFDADNGLCCFRIWGPHVERASVQFEHSEVSMQREKDEFWAVVVQGIREGSRYRFALNSSWNDCFSSEGDTLIRRDPFARFAEFESNWCFVQRPPSSFPLFNAPPWTEWIIYELHCGTFVQPEKGESVFAAIVPKLPYIKSLGFSAVEFMPVQEYGGLWGYNPRLPMSVHGKYGTPQELRALVEACHEADIAVVFDLVLNHGSAKLNSLWNWDGYGPGGNGGIFFEGGSDTGWGRQFAFHKPVVRDMLLTAACVFLEEFGADGLRFDSVHNMSWQILQELTSELKKRYPGKMLIAEVTPENPTICNEAGFDSCWIHAAYYDAVKILRDNERPFHMEMLKSIIDVHRGFLRSSQCVNSILGSHDQVGNRHFGQNDGKSGLYFVSMFGGRSDWRSRAQCRMWYALQAVSRGIPMLFMGTETHQDGWWNADEKHGFDWSLVNDELAKQMMRLVRAANFLRRGISDLSSETETPRFPHVDPYNRVLGIWRGRVLVVLNCGEGQWDELNYNLQTEWHNGTLKLLFNSQAEEFGGWKGSAAPSVCTSSDGIVSLTLPKWSVIIYQRE